MLYRRRTYGSSGLRTGSGARLDGGIVHEDTPTVNFYGLPPAEEDISVDEFELLAIERLKILTVIENGTSQGMRLQELGKNLGNIYE